MEYLIDRDAGNGRRQADGMLKDDQCNTYDQALHGVSTFMSGYYLAALRAGRGMGQAHGRRPTAGRFHAIFLKGRENLVRRCWNGEYFQQDLPDYRKRNGEVGPGCMADQLIGQWWAHQLGLGYILPKDKVQAALASDLQVQLGSRPDRFQAIAAGVRRRQGQGPAHLHLAQGRAARRPSCSTPTRSGPASSIRWPPT